jgi:hypothetical protein
MVTVETNLNSATSPSILQLSEEIYPLIFVKIAVFISPVIINDIIHVCVVLSFI